MTYSAGPLIVLPPILAYLVGVPVVPREAVERTIQAAIDALDLIDGDPDFESVGAEDDFLVSSDLTSAERMPGCPISDCDKGVDDDREGINEDGDVEIMKTLPRYGCDQSSGPINEAAAHRIHLQDLHRC